MRLNRSYYRYIQIELVESNIELLYTNVNNGAYVIKHAWFRNQLHGKMALTEEGRKQTKLEMVTDERR